MILDLSESPLCPKSGHCFKCGSSVFVTNATYCIRSHCTACVSHCTAFLSHCTAFVSYTALLIALLLLPGLDNVV